MKKENLVDSLVNKIRSKILQWDYMPGTHLVEQDLSKTFGVSRIPLREAFRVLETNGLLEKKQNKGYMVKQISLKDSLELFDLRIALETYICEQLAGMEIASESFQKLRDLWDVNKIPDSTDPQIIADLDRTFHESLCELYGNKALLKQLKDINDRIVFLRVIDFKQEKIIKSSSIEHLGIIDAIEDKNPHDAREAVRLNIQHAQKNIKKGLSEMLATTFMKD